MGRISRRPDAGGNRWAAKRGRGSVCRAPSRRRRAGECFRDRIDASGIDLFDPVPLWLRTSEYEHETQHDSRPSPSTLIARYLFLWAIRAHAREVINDLRSLKPYGDAAFQATEGDFEGVYLFCLEWLTYGNYEGRMRIWRKEDKWQLPSPMLDALSRFYTCVDEWTGRWRLSAEWCKAHAFHLLVPPKDDAAFQAYWMLPPGSTLPLFRTPMRSRFTLSQPGYEPSRERRQDAARRLRMAFECMLQAHLDGGERVAQARGLRPTPRKSPEHFVWLVQYQVHGWSFQRLADEVCRDRKTVEAGIKEAAGLINLALRPPAPGGRPRKGAA